MLTSDRAPKRLEALEDRLRNRFEWGLITDVQPPDLETRIAILRKKAIQENLSVPDDVMEFIASRISSNIRELEGALIRVTAFASLNRQPVDMALAETVLKDLIPGDGGSRTRHDVVVAVVASTARGEVGVVTTAGRVVKLGVLDLPTLPSTANHPNLQGGAPVGEFVTLDGERAKFFSDNEDRVTAFTTPLVFTSLEFNRIEDDHLAALYGQSQELFRYKPHLDRIRAMKPYQLSDELERFAAALNERQPDADGLPAAVRELLQTSVGYSFAPGPALRAQPVPLKGRGA